MEYGIGEVKGDQLLARECYQTVLATNENHTWMIEEEEEKKIEAFETVELIDGELTRTTKIGMNLSTQMKKKLVQFLKKNLDIFVWNHKNMPDIATEVIQHRLNVDPKRKPI